MSFEPLRFIHAADCLLDSPLRDLGPLPADLVERVATATLTAFERVVAECVERSVDFLLLTGNVFDEAEESLAARIALVEGCALLAEANVDVLVWPGERDPRAAWEAIPGLPANVVLLPDDAEDVVEIARDGRAIAAIVRAASPSPGAIVEEPAPFVIGLRTRAEDAQEARAARFPPAPGGIDYLALGGNGPRHTSRSRALFSHHPGATQGLAAGQTGPHGCTLIEVDAEGISRAAFLPTAPVRREEFSLAIEPYTHRDDLLDSMTQLLATRRAEPGEDIRLCTWRIAGAGRLCRQLAEEDVWRELVAQLAERQPLPNSVAMHHEHRLTPVPPGDPPHDEQAAEYLAQLEEHAGRGSAGDGARNAVESLLNAVPAGWPVERDHLEPAAVLAHARRWGEEWFAAEAEKGLAT